MASLITINGKSEAARKMIDVCNLFGNMKGKALALKGIVAQQIGDDATGQTVADNFGCTDAAEGLALASRVTDLCAVLEAEFGDPDYVSKIVEFFDPMVY